MVDASLIATVSDAERPQCVPMRSMGTRDAAAIGSFRKGSEDRMLRAFSNFCFSPTVVIYTHSAMAIPPGGFLGERCADRVFIKIINSAQHIA